MLAALILFYGITKHRKRFFLKPHCIKHNKEEREGEILFNNYNDYLIFLHFTTRAG